MEERGLSLEEQELIGKEACKEYKPRWPLWRYNGICVNYVFHKYSPCGVPFIKRLICLTGHNDDKELELNDPPVKEKSLDREPFPRGIFHFSSTNNEGLQRIITNLVKASAKGKFKIEVIEQEKRGMTTVLYGKETIIFTREGKRGAIIIGYNKRYYK